MFAVHPEHEKDINNLSNYFSLLLQSLSINNKIHPYYYLEPSNRSLNHEYRTSIIDYPEEKLSYEIIDFDASSNLALISNVLRDANPRFKELLVVNRGVGGGKTRCLEELKMLANEKIENCLAIAITYNIDWELESSEFRRIVNLLYPDKASQKDHVIAVGVVFSVITRITSMIYGVPFDIATKLYMNNLATFPKLSFESFYLVLVSFIKAIVGELRRSGRTIDNFVLLLDETARVNEMLDHEFNILNRDIWLIIRQAMLTSSQLLIAIAEVNTALVISSLEYSTLHVSQSYRSYTAIIMPDKLNTADVYNKWLSPLLHRHGLTVPDDQVPVLKRFTTACERSPRTLEMFGKALVDYLQQSGGTLNSDAYNDIFAETMALVKSRYPDLAHLPKGLYMHALLFAYAIRADDAVMELVQISMYSNSIESFSPKSRYMLTPVTSFILLTAAAEEELESVGANRLAKLISELHRNFLQCIVSNDIEAVLKGIMKYAFKVKLVCDSSYPAGELSFPDLLCIKGELGSADIVFQHKYRLNLALPKGPEIREVLLPSYEEDKRGFYKVLTDPANLPSAIIPYVFFNSDGGNAFDFVIAAYTGEGSLPLVLLIDYKSAKHKDSTAGAEVVVDDSRKGLEHMPQHGARYSATRQLLMDDSLSDDIDASTGLLRQIRQDGTGHTGKESWVYVYMSTDTYYTEPFAVGNCLLLGPSQVNAFLGPFQGIYEACQVKDWVTGT